MRTATEIWNVAFSPENPRSPRSYEYKSGVLAVLKSRLHGIKCECPYKPGTAQSDAFFSGANEAHSLADEEIKKFRETVEKGGAK